MSDEAVQGVIVMVLASWCFTACGGYCQGYTRGYDDHRRDVCVRSGGQWMEKVNDGTRRACVTGERR